MSTMLVLVAAVTMMTSPGGLLQTALGSSVDLSSLYSNAAYQCAADRCYNPTQQCTAQTGCNAVLACRQACYTSYPLTTNKLSLVNCLESCPAQADSTGSALYAQYEACYTVMCQDVVQYELCAGYNTEQVCETQEGCTFLSDEAEPCVYGDFQAPEFTACEVGIARPTRETSNTQAVSWRTIEAQARGHHLQEDDRGGVVVVEQIEGPSRGSEFPIGTTQIAYRATDESGNTADCEFTVTIYDDTAPTLVNCPSSRTVRPDIEDIIYDENSVPLVHVEWIAPLVEDNDAAALVPPSPERPEANLTAGVHTFEYRAEDNAGNVDTCSFDIDIQPSSTTFFQRRVRTSLDHTQPIATFPVRVNPNACALRCLSDSECSSFLSSVNLTLIPPVRPSSRAHEFSTDRLGVGLCSLLRENTTTATTLQEFSRDLYERQPFSAFECAYTAVAACGDLADLPPSTCASDISDVAACAHPYLEACRDSQFVRRTNDAIVAANNTCYGIMAEETLPPSSAYECDTEASSFEQCYSCCTSSFETAVEDCDGLVALLSACMSEREEHLDVCASDCFDAFTQATAPSDDVPSGYVDVVLPLLLSDVPFANVSAHVRADIFLSAVAAFEFNSSALVFQVQQVDDGSTLVTFSIRLPSTYTVPEVDLDSSFRRRRRDAVRAAEIASLLQDANVLAALVARFRFIFQAETGFSTAVGVTTMFSVSVAEDSASLLTTTSTSASSTASGGSTTSAASASTATETSTTTIFVPRFSGSSNEETTSTGVVIVGVLGALLFVIFVIVLVKTIKRKKVQDRRRSSWVQPVAVIPSQSSEALPTTSPSTRHVRGGYFGPGIVLPDIGASKKTGSPALAARRSPSSSMDIGKGRGSPTRAATIARPQPPAALPSLTGPQRPAPSNPFARVSASKHVLPPSPSPKSTPSPKSKRSPNTPDSGQDESEA
ncbi:hypothetical protein PTSG_06354 [Salpingoeca rosetta]|uniref:HYR domain-containing protein n=1 Tax=Salpingoeca rosetta (strain ATCC 50818 / BSB-021) TaxID=946362 RepID=F2UCN7_SALR5|nr:uncharacterized protein PTSG_06354 [Salpingoeca rosetta]EGD74344.1 hypothetical protein PTSG_06354 [Salpingoeca rosetta]|eukprot:XP_004993244.1 hypothetical protein PTSG_06354 [Salpingoeca rosetta]